MHTGMLWFDNSAVSTAERIQKGIEYYIKKYKREPDMVLVHPSMLEGDNDMPKNNVFSVVVENAPRSVKATVRPYRPVLPGHIWIGIEDKK